MAAAVVAAVIGVFLFVLLTSTRRRLAELRRALDEGTEQTAALAASVDALRRLVDPEPEPAVPDPPPPFLSLATPVIKARALRAGTSSAARALRDRRTGSH